MYAIETYFIAPANARGARIKARVMEGRTANGGPARSITLPWDPAFGPQANHRDAAEALVRKLGWSGDWICGGGPDGSCIWVTASGYQAEGFFVPEADR